MIAVHRRRIGGRRLRILGAKGEGVGRGKLLADWKPTKP